MRLGKYDPVARDLIGIGMCQMAGQSCVKSYSGPVMSACEKSIELNKEC